MQKSIGKKWQKRVNRFLKLSLFLGLDLGTSGIRTSVIDDEGKLISSAQTQIPKPIKKGRRKIQSPLIWWSLVKNIIILIIHFMKI